MEFVTKFIELAGTGTLVTGSQRFAAPRAGVDSRTQSMVETGQQMTALVAKAFMDNQDAAAGVRQVEANLHQSRGTDRAHGEIAVAELHTKCLAVAITPWLWMPLIVAAAIAPASSGSSP